MSFDKLAQADFIKKERIFLIKGGEGEYKFKAIAPSYTQKLGFYVAKNNGGDFFLEMVLGMIHDETGNKMSREQAESLPEEIIQKFISECVPLLDEKEDKKKTKS